MIKTLDQLTEKDIARNLYKEFKHGAKNARDNSKAYRRSEVIKNIQSSFDSPLVSAYWQGILWGLNNPQPI